ncbi:MAG: hypothetical protein ACI9FN_002317, partial [Saprospiraceae bacterium]
MRAFTFIIILILLFSGCEPSNGIDEGKRFSLIDPGESGITFRNDLVQSDSINIYTFRNFYNGAGIGLGDFNKDGLTDLFFAGNQVDNELYLNLGDFKFKNVSAAAGVASQNVWSTGVSIADINGDGWLDIYICKSGDKKGANRHNELFISNGMSINKEGEGQLTFKESSHVYGLDDIGLSTHAAFFDYDKDGDLDCYLLNNSYRTVGGYDLIPDQRKIRDVAGGNKLYRSELAQGEHRFTDVSEKAGIYGSAIGFGLGVAISDLNGDDWPDIFVSNDFFEKDYLYINNKDGTFDEQLEIRTQEISMGSMGADIADLNNDTRPEIFVTEMLPRDLKRYKSKAQFEDWNKHKLTSDNGYFHQFSRNSLQLNQGKGIFSEISRYAGVDATDWSWGALIADLDANGYQDIFVSNGIYLDLLDQDYINFFSDANQVREILHNPKKGMLGLVEKIPSVPIANNLFMNSGTMRLTESAKEWGLNQTGFSNGAAYGDLDNDGDLDLIVNNVNNHPFVLKNNSSRNNYIKVKLSGSSFNTQAIGAKVLVYAGEQIFYRELYPQRGFMSSVDPIIHIGLGDHEHIDSMVVRWPDNMITSRNSLEVNHLIEIDQNESATRISPNSTTDVLLKKSNISLTFEHQEVSYSDFDKESLLMKMQSKEGPACCSGDINNDGLEDFYVGGAAGQKGVLYVQHKNGSFQQKEIDSKSESEETDCIFFDANGDENIDLYVASGSSEFGRENSALIDRMYFQENGMFQMSNQILPDFKFQNTSSVAHLDYDKDGDQDLIVGVNSVPLKYGLSNSSYLLENDGQGIFRNVTKIKAPDLINIGMISDVSVGDFDRDGDVDISLIGEWTSPMFLENISGSFQIKELLGDNLNGLWNMIEARDIDQDGDLDFVLGNLGNNNQLKIDSLNPARLYINDFDKNGKIEQILSIKDNGKYVPFHTRNELIKQLPIIAKTFHDYKSYATAGMDEIFPVEMLSRSIVLEANQSCSGILMNNDNWNFSFIPFLEAAQMAPIYACEVLDLNGDGILDLLLGGNQLDWIPRLGSQKGSYGMCLLGKGEGKYVSIMHEASGYLERGEIRKIIKLNDKIIIAKNNMKM